MFVCGFGGMRYSNSMVTYEGILGNLFLPSDSVMSEVARPNTSEPKDTQQ
jgi:hypothetical protein